MTCLLLQKTFDAKSLLQEEKVDVKVLLQQKKYWCGVLLLQETMRCMGRELWLRYALRRRMPRTAAPMAPQSCESSCVATGESSTSDRALTTPWFWATPPVMR